MEVQVVGFSYNEKILLNKPHNPYVKKLDGAN